MVESVLAVAVVASVFVAFNVGGSSTGISCLGTARSADRPSSSIGSGFLVVDPVASSMTPSTTRSGSASAPRRWLRGLWAYYREYTHSAVHAAAVAALTIFGVLVFIDPLFAALAIVSYVGTPIVLYALDVDVGTDERRSGPTDGSVHADGHSDAGQDTGSESGPLGPRSGTGVTNTDIGSAGGYTGGERDDSDVDVDSDDGDTDSDSDDGDTDSDSDDGDTDSDSDDGDTDSDSDDGDTDSDSDDGDSDAVPHRESSNRRLTDD